MKALKQALPYAIGALLLAAGTPVSATPFTTTFAFTPTSGGQSLSVTNTDDAGNTLDFFRIMLDADSTLSNYSNPAWVNDQSVAGWSSDAKAFDPSYGTTPAELNDFKYSGIADGSTLGFSYNFDYTGLLAASAQTFSYEAYFGLCDSSSSTCANTTNELIPGSGVFYAGEATGYLMYTQPGPGPEPAPEPVTLSLLGIGLMALAVRGRHHPG